jgi:hypothetical protein
LDVAGRVACPAMTQLAVSLILSSIRVLAHRETLKETEAGLTGVQGASMGVVLGGGQQC